MKRLSCKQCERPLPVCFCHCLSVIENDWPVWIFQHHDEKKHAIGTAKIVKLSLKNIVSFDTKSLVHDINPMNEIISQQPILIYPSESTMEIPELKKQAPQPLLFLDGSWRKTRKMMFEYPALNKLTRLAINPVSASRYKIRKEPIESAISTVEAVAFVLSELEENTKKYQPMLNTMDWIINKQIEYMGEDTFRQNYKNNP